ncbi:MAG TPA: hypothetical protein VIG66_00015 [Noviherbaspirillum sp.]
MRELFLTICLLTSVAPAALAQMPAESMHLPSFHGPEVQFEGGQSVQAQIGLQTERRRPPQFELPGYSYTEGGGEWAEGRRSGKLSPEQRAALRRQINEASSDLYLPRR